MKLLIDENLPPGLSEHVADLFPGSVHVTSVGLGSTPDTVIWDFARLNHFVFLTKDRDFANLSLVRGAPPKVLLLQVGNSSTSQVEGIVRSNAIRIAEFERDSKRALMILAKTTARTESTVRI